jgi:hypothetical protein
VLNTENLTVDGLNYAPYKVYFTAVAVAPNNGTIYVGGSVGGSWTFLQSTDGGQNWNHEIYRLAKNFGGRVEDLAVDAGGNVYAAGWAYNRGGLQNRIVREYVAGAPSSGFNLQNYIPSGGQSNASASCIAARGSDLYVAGTVNYSVKKANYSAWVTQRGTADSTEWDGLDQYNTTEFSLQYPYDIAMAGNDGPIYVVGEQLSGGDPSTAADWVIRKSLTANPVDKDDWAPILPFQASYWSQANGIAIAANNDVLVCGYTRATSISSNEPSHAILLSGSGGTNWGIIDNYFLAGTSVRDCQYQNVTTDSAGNAYVVGTCENEAGQSRWVVREVTVPFTITPIEGTSTSQASAAPATMAAQSVTAPSTFSTTPVSDLLADGATVLGSKPDPVFVG